MSKKNIKPITNPAALFERFTEAGERELVSIREITRRDSNLIPKSPRTWGIQQAAELIGRSAPWLRENDPDVPRNTQNHGRWSLDRINAIRDQIGTRFVRPSHVKPIVMAIANFKGGVGKTTATAHLAHKAAIEGLRVLAIDLDPQATLTFYLGGLIPEVDLDDSQLINRYLLEEHKGVSQVVANTYFPGVDLIPTSLALQDLDLSLPNPELNNINKLGSPALRLRHALSLIEDNYDLILLDCPPNMGSITANALAAANALLTPLPPAYADRASFVMFCQSLELFYGHLGRELDYFRVLISRHDSSKSHEFNEERIRSLYEDHVLDNVLYDSAEIDKAASYMRTVYDLEKPINSRDTHNRCLESLDGYCMEVINDLKGIWGVSDER